MPKTRRTKIAFTVLAILPILILAVTVLAIEQGNGHDPGTWEASSVQDCPAGLVCMEWQLRFGQSTDPACCDDASKLGSTVYTACNGGGAHFRH